jgi:hypothetical protein
MRLRQIIVPFLAAIVTLACTAPPALAQAPGAWPTRAVTMVVPFAAGSASDTVVRILAARLSEVVGQQVVVENVGGAGGMTGAARAAKAAPGVCQVYNPPGGAGTPQDSGRHRGAAGAALHRVSQDIPRARDREVGGDHQAERGEPGSSPPRRAD